MGCNCNKKSTSSTLDALKILQDKYLAAGAQILFNLDLNLKNKTTLPDHNDFLQSVEMQIINYSHTQSIVDSISLLIEGYLNEQQELNEPE